MDSPRRESSRVIQNRREEKRWRQMYKKHKSKILSIKPTISASSQNENYDYLHVQLRLKKLQMEEDRFAIIDYQNRKLMERIINIVGDLPPASKSPRTKSPGRAMRTKTIERENERIHERLENVKPFISSAATSSGQINETREKLRKSEEQRIMEENKNLKERIDAARHRLNLTPPSKSVPRASFEDRYELEAREIDKQNLRIKERLESIEQSGPTFEMESTAHVKRQPAKVKSYSADNREMRKRITNTKSTINTSENQKSGLRASFEDRYELEAREIDKKNLRIKERLESILQSGPTFEIENSTRVRRQPRKVKSYSAANREMKQRINNTRSIVDTSKTKEYRPRFADSHTPDEKIIKENKEMQKRILKIMSSQKPANKTGQSNKKSPRIKHIEAWANAIEKENKILSERLKNVKPMMSTRHQDSFGPYVPYDDPYQEKNKKMRERLARIRRGEAVSPLNQSKELESGDEGQNDEVMGNKQEGKKKAKKKVYNVPKGYHKKFRKRRKKFTKKNGDFDDDDSDFETDTDTETD